MGVVRSLSFSRRRNKGGTSKSAAPSMPDDDTEDRTEPANSEEGGSGGDPEGDYMVPDGPLQPLGSKVLKKHHNTMKGWGSRYLELEDAIGVMYVFDSEKDQQRRTPKHVYACADMKSANKAKNSAANYCFEITFRSPEDWPNLFYSCESKKYQEAWVNGLGQRIALGRSFGTRSMKLQVPSHNYELSRFGQFGVRVINWEGQPIGVAIDSLTEISPLAEAGLAPGDVIIAVNQDACLSHTHAVKLLEATKDDVELIVWQPPPMNYR